MLGLKTWVSDHLNYHVTTPESLVNEYVGELVECMRTAYEMLHEKQWQVSSKDSEEPATLSSFELGLNDQPL